MGEDAFRVAARVIEALPNGTFCAELSNGHRLTALWPGGTKRFLPARKPVTKCGYN